MPSRVLAQRDLWQVEAGHMRTRVITYPSLPIPRLSPKLLESYNKYRVKLPENPVCTPTGVEEY